jgi:hypothetical protein
MNCKSVAKLRWPYLLRFLTNTPQTPATACHRNFSRSPKALDPDPFSRRSLHKLRQIQGKRDNCTPASNRTVNGGQDELTLFDTAEVMVMD